MSNTPRSLTAGEIALASSIFGADVDYSNVTIHPNDNHVFVPFSNVHAPNGNIYYPEQSIELYSDDFSVINTPDDFQRSAVFIHEMAHVYQHQNGMNVLLEVIGPQIAAGFVEDVVYDWSKDIWEGDDFTEMTPERQAAMIEDYYRMKSGYPPANVERGEYSGEYSNDPSSSFLFEIIEAKLPANFGNGSTPRCFLAGTQITVAAGGSTKAIERIRVGDRVTSYDNVGHLNDGLVTAVTRSEVAIVLDWFGTGVTPGHVTLCAAVDGEEGTDAARLSSPDGSRDSFVGRHVPLIDILRADGAVMTREGSLVRAATNEPVGSRKDAYVKCSIALTAKDLEAGWYESGRMRVGTKLLTNDGETVSVLELIEANGYEFDTETGLVTKDGVTGPLPFFGPLPKPEDYTLAMSKLTLEDIYAANEWEEGARPESPMVQ